MTSIYYNSNGQIASIVDPGGEQSSFVYNNDNLLAKIIDPLANDVIAQYGVMAYASTDIAYSRVDTMWQVSSVTLPAPDGVTASLRPKKTYTHGSPGTSYVDIDGLDAGSGNHNVTVGYDSSWRQTSTTSAMNVSATQNWLEPDLQVRSTDVNRDLVTTTAYDGLDRATDVYGPAPAACFSTDVSNAEPVSGCDITPAHSETGYDVGLEGLNAVYYVDDLLSGAPKKFALGLDDADSGGVAHEWSTTAPVDGATGGRWSVRLTGVLKLDKSGQYDFRVTSSDAARFFVDGLEVIDYWKNTDLGTSQEGAFISDAPTGGHVFKRVRFEFANPRRQRRGRARVAQAGFFHLGDRPRRGIPARLRTCEPHCDTRRCAARPRPRVGSGDRSGDRTRLRAPVVGRSDVVDCRPGRLRLDDDHGLRGAG